MISHCFKELCCCWLAMSILVAHNRWPGRPIQLLFSEVFKKYIDKRLMSLILTKSIYFWKSNSAFQNRELFNFCQKNGMPQGYFGVYYLEQVLLSSKYLFEGFPNLPHHTAHTQVQKLLLTGTSLSAEIISSYKFKSLLGHLMLIFHYCFIDLVYYSLYWVIIKLFIQCTSHFLYPALSFSKYLITFL